MNGLRWIIPATFRKTEFIISEIPILALYWYFTCNDAIYCKYYRVWSNLQSSWGMRCCRDTELKLVQKKKTKKTFPKSLMAQSLTRINALPELCAQLGDSVLPKEILPFDLPSRSAEILLESPTMTHASRLKWKYSNCRSSLWKTSWTHLSAFILFLRVPVEYHKVLKLIIDITCMWSPALRCWPWWDCLYTSKHLRFEQLSNIG